MKHYSLKVKIIGGAIIVFECLIIIIGLGYYYYSIYASQVLGVSVARISKENVDLHAEGNLKHYYEWGANQEIFYKNNWLPQAITKYTNNDGILGQINYDTVKPKDVFRILTIGDSFTEGMYVVFEETYPAKLGAMLNALRPCAAISRYEIINLGVGGYDIEYSAARFLSKGVKYDADLVIWLLKDDDFEQRTELERAREEQYLLHVQEDLGGDVTALDAYKFRVNDIDKGGTLWDTIHSLVVHEQIEEANKGENFQAQEKIIETVANNIDVPILMVSFIDTKSVFKAAMKVWATKKNFYFFDGIPSLSPTQETFEPYDGHPNAQGYDVIATSIFKYLAENYKICN